MATGQLNGVFKNLRGMALGRDADTLADAQLLDCFIAHHSEPAFAGLVRRHGAMVFGVCRRLLTNTHDAEDAFQAVFLVLAKKAATVWPREMVGNWLYGVAYRTALKARSMIAKRHAREKQVLELPETAERSRAEGSEAGWSDLQPHIDSELNRLAAKYRVPVVLCDLEGTSQRDAARQLGWPEGTLMTRLARARRILAKRLARHGIALSAAALATLLATHAAAATPPLPLTISTVNAAGLVATGQAASAVSAHVAALTEGVLHTMFVAKCKSAVIALFVIAVLGAGVGFCAHWSAADRLAAAERGPAFNRGPEDPQAADVFVQERGGREDREAANLVGKIVAVAKDGKSISVETPSTVRREGPVKHDIKLNDKTDLKFFGVGPDGAKLTVGFLAQIWTSADAKDVAAKIVVGGMRRAMDPDLSGKLTAMSKDGGTLTFEVARRDEDAKTAEIKLTISTVLTYSGIAKGGAMPTVGYSADVWLARGSKTEAAAISFRGSEGVDRDRVARRDPISSRLVSISKDGKLITLEMPPKERGGEGMKIDIKVDDKTRVTYHNVGPGGDQPMEGYGASVVLVEGSKDTAAAVTFLAPHKERLQTLRGPVTGVGKDGKSFSVEIPPTERGQPVEKLTIKITEHTRVLYNGVGLNGARLTEGHSAMIWLDEGSRDAAFQVIFGPPHESGRR